ncbi:hypothetical protein LOAG_02153 [Loa loa]|uniref:Uncharacterized protein n=1 Tax=Loa loa TaxID=7209 RepID=A0A1S0U7K0_LOALO|nr:hypothetical protein LOAG_02153 [Loa loa]EFO26329.1 hypothetical protein LOAG_02153 [Loa loa]
MPTYTCVCTQTHICTYAQTHENVHERAQLPQYKHSRMSAYYMQSLNRDM